eukprot:TRINITY_DN4293_c0_g2_i1.p1 TRINITY_DN4293_c0_g2~~TRINITY_DN4293_c0_g2_i1.p1  ORF type:complete len:560 (+),score=62.45 TRINITY_DN4293_c0_g2_i1:191-1870(+)
MVHGLMSIMPSLKNLEWLTGETTSLAQAMVVFAGLITMTIIVGHFTMGGRWINESIVSIFLGIIAGSIVLCINKSFGSHILNFNEELFFLYILPPIIFNAGFQVKKKHFFRNFGAIMMYGILGVFISFSIIAWGCYKAFPWFDLQEMDVQDYLALGIIFSATDSVCTLQVLSQRETPLLYSVVFGEGVVNDATSVVLFNSIRKFSMTNISGRTAVQLTSYFAYLFTFSTLLGIAGGLLTAYLLKELYFGRHSTNREIAIMLLMPYYVYLQANILGLSGILSVFFCGIVMSHYTYHNLSEMARITTRHLFATLSFVAESFIFLYVGMDSVNLDGWKRTELWKGIGLSLTFVLLTMVGRAAFVFPLAGISNYFRPVDKKLLLQHQIIVWWAGLMRGAVSIALVLYQFTRQGETFIPQHRMIVASTMVVVLFTTVVFGVLTKPLISWLIARHISSHGLSSPFLNRQISIHEPPPISNGSTPSHGSTPSQGVFTDVVADVVALMEDTARSGFHKAWHTFDENLMQPLFGRGPTALSDVDSSVAPGTQSRIIPAYESSDAARTH